MSNPSASWVIQPDESLFSLEEGETSSDLGVDFLLEDGDIVFGEDIQMVSGVEAVAQMVRIRLQMFKGEWFLDANLGMPWFDEILGYTYNETLTRKRVRDLILGTEGVIELVSLELSFESSTRELTITWTATAEDGTFTDSLGQVI